MRRGLPLLLAVLLLPPPAVAQVLVEIGQERYSVEEFQRYLREINPRMEFSKLPPSEQRHWLDEFVSHKLLAARARQAGLHERPEVRSRISFFEERVLAQALREQMAQEVVVSEDEVREHYQSHPPMLPARAHLEHLIYRDAGAAEGARQRLRAGTPFAELAAEHGSNPALRLAQRSWFTAEALPPEVAEAAFALPAGEVSEVIGSVQGFHVLRVESREPSRPQELAAARPQLLEQLRRLKAGRLYRELLEESRREHQVRIHFDPVQR